MDNRIIMEIKVLYALSIWLVKSLSEYKIYKGSISKYGSAFRIEQRKEIERRSYISSRTLHALPTAMRIKYEEFIQEGSLMVLEGTILDMMDVYDDLDNFILDNKYDVRTLGFNPYNAKEFVERWQTENGPYGLEKVIQGSKTESVPLGELKKLSEARLLLFDEALMSFAMGNAITLEAKMETESFLKSIMKQK